MNLSDIECPKMHWDGNNITENWRHFKQFVELMFSGPFISREEAEKCSYLLIWVGVTSPARKRLSCNDITIDPTLTLVPELTLSLPDLNFKVVFKDYPKQQRNLSQISAKTAISKIQTK